MGDIRNEYPILDYSVTSFLFHVRAAEATGVSQAHLIHLLSGLKSEVLDCWQFFARLCYSGPLNINALLVESGAPTLALLELASATNTLSLISALLSGLALKKPDFNSSLWIGAAYGNFYAVQLMLHAGANPNDSNGLGHTTLHIAAQKDCSLIAKELLRPGAYVHLADRFGWIALHRATESGDLGVLKLILDAGARDKVQTSDGMTALTIAVKKEHAEIVQMLLAAGSELDVADKFGRTPLYLAASSGHKEVVELLLEKRPNTEARTSDGYTAQGRWG
ncbi:hypothetical protein GP486_003896 [Trichoglossum hirsutum]|uniref:Ankyrin repeat protein n=1 Tax=Trichoglossum hirsutum TaxID=265104 RepID=A0A9P8LC64_9PEZI|nr:hypothetical protein GP486_003896 [Trichoglossum hirsutum]